MMFLGIAGGVYATQLHKDPEGGLVGGTDWRKTSQIRQSKVASSNHALQCVCVG